MDPDAVRPAGWPRAGQGLGCRRTGVDGGTAQDRGSVTVPVAIGLLALLSIIVVAVQLAAVVAGRHRAETAADLGALAGAALALQGPTAGCARAAEVVRANAASVLSCRWEGWEILVETSVRAGPLGLSAGGRARAGPDLRALIPDPG